MRFFITTVMAIAVLIIVLAGCGAPQQACPKIGDKAPDFTLPGIDGKTISLSSFAGKPVVINTWYVGCIECKREMPFFQDVLITSGQNKVAFISVNTMDNTADVKKFLSDNKYTFNVVSDMYRKMVNSTFCFPKSGPGSGDPYTIFIDSKGIVKNIVIGGFSNKEDLLKAVEQISPAP
jgi:peroxiredoxin